jgi:hypothetical protein
VGKISSQARKFVVRGDPSGDLQPRIITFHGEATASVSVWLRSLAAFLRYGGVCQSLRWCHGEQR